MGVSVQEVSPAALGEPGGGLSGHFLRSTLPYLTSLASPSCTHPTPGAYTLYSFAFGSSGVVSSILTQFLNSPAGVLTVTPRATTSARSIAAFGATSW